jgi:type III secretion system YscQ/HrcQ family protein
MAKKLRKFRWSKLPHCSRVQARAVNALLTHFPQLPFETGFKDKVRATLEPLLRVSVDVWLEDVRVVEDAALPQVVAQPACLAIVGVVPVVDKVLVELDLPLAQHAIDLLIGGDGGDVDATRALSEIEDGVLSFLLLKVLSVAQEAWGSERQWAMKLEGVHGSLSAARGFFPADERFVALTFKVFLQQRIGVTRVFLPARFIEQELPVGWPSEGPARDRLLSSYQQRRNLIRLFRSPLSVEVGRLSLPMADIDGLEREDIVLVEQTDVRLVRPEDDEDAPSYLTGQVSARVGSGAHGTLFGSVAVGAQGRYEVTIDAIVPVGEPRAMGMLFPPEAGMSDEESAMEESRRIARPHLVDETQHAAHLRAAAAARLQRSSSGAEPLLGSPTEPEDRGHAIEHSDAYEGDDEAPSAEAAALLDDVTVAMVVELGRVMVSAADVMGLRPGQVIELSRQPGEPVDLVVDGKRIGKGELVEIDGELGVRILSLSK